ncbi:hypothetical protein UFOVP74_15 [uncultured Caudovirales phage]|uniref:Uncharacterized protein n=1 Tax=uncultured Caudovirales phage TaxID=2100421 RepID=A0A6J5L1Z4_9CAUD|nr:hypothetical protein UFOVP74_15 [uncultured Caudovirales phage]
MSKELEQARRLYKTGSEETKATLEEVFGKEALQVTDWKDIKTLADACAATGVNINALESMVPIDMPKWLVNSLQKVAKVMVINKALNGEWTPDYHNKDQRKHRPWFISSPGRGLVFFVVHCDGTFTNVGPRLVLESADKAKHAASFPEYVDYINELQEK